MSLARLHEHRELWSRKDDLRLVYTVWFEELLERIPRGARVLEIGAGPGFLSAHARATRPDLTWLASDLLAAPWNNLVANALCLPCGDCSLDAVVGIDVLHHLGRPFEFLREAARVLRPGGQLALVEPWVTPLSYPVYRFLHQEGCVPGIDAREPFGADKAAFDGDAAVPGAVVKAGSASELAALGLGLPSVEHWPTFAYLLTLGFRPGSLLPRVLLRPLQRLDRACRPLGRLLALRALLVWPRL